MKIKLHVVMIWLLVNIITSLVANYLLDFKGDDLGLLLGLENLIVTPFLIMNVSVEDDANLTIFKIDK